MAQWKTLALCALLTLVPCGCSAEARWWEDLFTGMDDTTSDSGEMPWWDEYYSEQDKWWESTDDEIEWERSSATTAASGNLSGPGVCVREVMETRYYYVNVSYPCWKWTVVPCPSNSRGNRRVRRSYSRGNRRVRRGAGQSSHICYSYSCETCTKRERRCGYETVRKTYCCRGYQENGNGGCKESIKCGNNNGGCSHLCKTDGRSHMCECFPGFDLVGGTQCVDKNECNTGEAGCNHFCKNSIGSYYCGCRSGFALMGPTTCEDVDECKRGNGGCEHNCKNTHGAFYCECEEGYKLEMGYMCEDVNECELHNGGCSHDCENLDGSYRCKCPDIGYFLGNDHKTCLPLLNPMNATGVPSVTEDLPEDLPFMDANGEEEVKSGVNGALIGGIVGGIIGLGLLTLLAVGLAKYFGFPCICAGAGAAAATGATDNYYETPIVVSAPIKKGFCDAGKGPSHTDMAYDNYGYGRSIENITGVTGEPPAYSEADPIESPYSDVDLPTYDNLAAVPTQTPSAPIYDNLQEAPLEYDNLSNALNAEPTKGDAFDNKIYGKAPGLSTDDIISAKNLLKSTGKELA